MKVFSIHVIRAAISLLQKLGYLSIRKNSRDLNWRNGQDKTHQYLLNVDLSKPHRKNSLPLRWLKPLKTPHLSTVKHRVQQ
jgi:hypothetical protein